MHQAIVPPNRPYDLKTLWALLGSAPTGVAVFDRDLRYVYANARLREMRGRDPVGLTLQQVAPDIADDVTTLLRSVLDGGATIAEHQLRSVPAASNETRDLRATYFPVREADVVMGVGVIIRDVTDQVHTEAALREWERRFRDLLGGVRLAATITDGDSTIHFANEHLATLTGYSVDELTGSRWLDLLVPADMREGEENFYRLLAREEAVIPHESGVPLVTRDGRVRMMAWSNTPLLDDHGHVWAVAGIGEDVTDRLDRERALEHRAAQHEAVAGLSQLALAGGDVDTLLAQAVDLVRDVLAVEAAIVVEIGDGEQKVRATAGRAGTGAPAPDPAVGEIVAGAGLVIEHACEVLGHSARAAIGVPLRLGDGVWGALVGIDPVDPQFGPDALGFLQAAGGILGAVLARDRAERALEQSERQRRRVLSTMLRAEDEERARIASDLHDDTVQVMTATLMQLDRVLLSSTDAGAEQLRPLIRAARETLGDATERTRRLMFELRPQRLQTSGLGAAVRELTETVLPDVEFDVDLQVEVERYAPAVEALVYRALAELLSNVHRHAGPSHVTVELVERDGVLAACVEDDGRGFDVQAIHADPRMRLHIGLESLRERIDLAGGWVDISSQPGKGTRAAFGVPLPGQRPGHA